MARSWATGTKVPLTVGLAGSHPPLYVAGLVRAIERAGHRAEEPGVLDTWFRSASPAVLLVGPTLRDVERAVASRDACAPSVPIVALLPESDHQAFPAAISDGADAVLPTSVCLAHLAAAIELSHDGYGIVPRPAGAGLDLGEGSVPFQLDDTERQLLQGLLDGASVEVLAATLAYSQRTVYRKLRLLYEAIGVLDRREAILKLARMRWNPVEVPR